MLKKKIMSALLSQMMILSAVPFAAQTTAFAANTNPTLTFSNTAVTETVSGIGYTIDGTTLTISAAGVYKIKGKCSEGSIVVSKSLDNVTLIFDSLSLTSAQTAPVVVKKGSNVTIHLDGTSTLTDNEDASTEDTNEDFEGAAIKVKSGSNVTFCGDGTLNVYGNAKNGIKGAAESTQTFNGGSYNVTAVNNGIAADESITINGGTFNINSDNDGIKSVPDTDDTVSTGTVTINGGTFNITADGDGIQAENTLKITNGNFTIKTMNGYNDSSFNSDTGLPDSTGEGQVNFTVVLKSGYELDSVTVTGGYKNLKDVSTDTLPNTYRVTKVTSDLTITVKTKSSATALTNNSTLSATSITLGTKITATCKATGGTGTYQYQVVYKQTAQTSWTTAQNFGTNATVTFKPAKATIYDVCVKVKDGAGTIVKKFFTVTVSQGLTNSSALSSTSITLGNTVTATCKATGGTGYYNYAVYYKRTSQTSWTTSQNFSANEEVTFKPAAATTYDVCVKVKDVDGTLVKKYFTLTVSK